MGFWRWSGVFPSWMTAPGAPWDRIYGAAGGVYGLSSRGFLFGFSCPLERFLRSGREGRWRGEEEEEEGRGGRRGRGGDRRIIRPLGEWTTGSSGRSSAPASPAPSSGQVGGSGSTPSSAAPSRCRSSTTFRVPPSSSPLQIPDPVPPISVYRDCDRAIWPWFAGIFASLAALMFNGVKKEDIDYSPYEDGEWRSVGALAFLSIALSSIIQSFGAIVFFSSFSSQDFRQNFIFLPIW